ncbi:F-box protein SKIP14 [Sesamum indicum]|uniref:F-box protein SKIP14 n=1 Tax=Sesamum indicum TaxID=4182 RepID=A0A6I9UFD6_SESIN|nr:F-box protein SKIP14 [Sesamum indicum]
MVLNQEENVCGGVRSDDGYFMEGWPGAETEELVDFDDSESHEGYEDIADLLPNDPFGMEINIGLPNDPCGMDFNISLPTDPFGMDFNIEATVAAITGWIEDFGLKACGLETDEASEDKNTDDNKFFAELNFVWTSSMEYEQEEGKNEVVGSGIESYPQDGSYDDRNMSGSDMEGLMFFGCEKYQNEHVNEASVADGGAPADALFFALGYLGVMDLLSVERVCKPLRDAVQNDPLLWRNIHIDLPLNDKITDDDLLRLTNRAQGTLASLNLVKCFKITNAGLKRVLQSNPGMTKLSVPGCTRLSIEDVLHDLKVFNSVALPGIKLLRICELFGLTNQHLKDFKLLLGADEDKKPSNYKPRFYRAGQLYLSLDDERVIDVETCPRCQHARSVYDCPAESCQAKIHSVNACRACIFCIARCISCGCCLDNKAYEETFCLDLLCLDCLAQLLNYQDRVTLSPLHTCLRQKSSYHVVLYG